MLRVELKKCIGEGCKSEGEILDFFDSKFLLMLTNQERFITDGYFENSIARESTLKWISVTTQIRSVKSFEFAFAKLNLQDSLANLDAFQPDGDTTVFSLNPIASQGSY